MVEAICTAIVSVVTLLVFFTDFFEDVGQAIKEWAKSRKRIT